MFPDIVVKEVREIGGRACEVKKDFCDWRVWLSKLLAGNRYCHMVDGLVDIWKRRKFLHFDNCVKPWNPEFIERCRNSMGATLVYLRYAEEVRKVGEFLKDKGKNENWEAFATKFRPCFSSIPEKVEEAFNVIDMEAYLNHLRENCETLKVLQRYQMMGNISQIN